MNAQEKIHALDNPMSEEYLLKNIRRSSPRLVYTPDLIEQVRLKVKSDPVSKNLYEAIKLNAETIYSEPLLERIKVGKRLLSTSRELLYRINMLGFVYLMERDVKALVRINKEILAVCSFSDWNPSHFLDVAEMALGISLAMDWTAGDLPEATIRIAKKALVEKGIKPSWPASGKRWHTAYGTNNWNQVCNGGLIAASLTVAEDEPKLAANTIHRALDGLPNAMVAYSPDGVYPEGSTYWAYATSYSVATIAMFESALGYDFGLYEYPGFKESAVFRSLCNAPSGWYYNYFDCGDQRGSNGDEILAWLAMKSGNSTFFEKERFLQPVDKMAKLSRFYGMAMAWIAPFEEKAAIGIPDAWKGDGVNPIVIFRGREGGPNGFYLGCKGGRASISHGNMDAGSFIFELNGVRWSVDPGNQPYHELEKTGFDLWGRGQESDRWTLLTKNNFGHSTLTVNDCKFKYDAHAPLLNFSGGENPEATFDLTAVYGGNLTGSLRTFRKEGPGSLLIHDAIGISEKTKMITWQMMTVADVKITEVGAILEQDGKKLMVENLSHPGIAFSVISLHPGPLALDRQIEGLKRLELRIPAWVTEGGKADIRIRLSE